VADGCLSGYRTELDVRRNSLRLVGRERLPTFAATHSGGAGGSVGRVGSVGRSSCDARGRPSWLTVT